MLMKGMMGVLYVGEIIQKLTSHTTPLLIFLCVVYTRKI